MHETCPTFGQASLHLREICYFFSMLFPIHVSRARLSVLKPYNLTLFEKREGYDHPFPSLERKTTVVFALLKLSYLYEHDRKCQ